MAEPLTALQIKRIGVKTWTIIENGIAATEKGENAYTGGAHENGTINIKTMNGATVRNQIPFQIISYTDTIDSSNNRASFTSAAQFLKYGNDVGFFVDGSSGSGATTSFIELEDTFPTYIGREGQALVVNESATGVDSIPFNNVNVSTDLADFPAALVEGKYLKVVDGVWQLIDGIEGEQNNIGYVKFLGFIASTPTITNVITRLNNSTLNITEQQTPVIVFLSGLLFGSGQAKSYPYLFLPGKGTYGIGGTTVTESMLFALPVLNTTPEDITSKPNNEINNLDPVIDGDFVTKANQGVWDFTDSTYPEPDKNYYFTYTDDGVLYFALFVGEPGVYGTGGIQFTEDDFVTTTNSEVEPELPLIERTSQLINDGEDGSSQYATEIFVENADAALKTYVDGLVVGLFRLAGNWDASAGTFPGAGTGTGSGGAIRRGDSYIITVSGTINGQFYGVGDSFYALANNPGQTPSNWGRFEVPTGQATDVMAGILLLFSATGSSTIGTMTQKAITDALLLKADLASPNFSGIPTAPTAVAGTNTTQLATTAFVQGAIIAGALNMIRQGGNTFGTNLSIGTNDNFGIDYRNNGVVRYRMDNQGLGMFNGRYLYNLTTFNDFNMLMNVGGGAIMTHNIAGTSTPVLTINNKNATATSNILTLLSKDIEVAGVRNDGRVYGSNAAANNDFITLSQLTAGTSGVVAQTITYGITTSAPSQDAVFDALVLKANDSDVVHRTGDETVNGIKTFISSPVVPDGALASHAVNKGQLDLKANDNAVLHTTGNETFSGMKTSTGNIGIGATAVNTWKLKIQGDFAWTAVDAGNLPTFELYNNTKQIRVMNNVILIGYSDTAVTEKWRINSSNGAASFLGEVSVASATASGSAVNLGQLNNALALKQALLVSGANIKTVNGITLLGSGNLVVGDIRQGGNAFAAPFVIGSSDSQTVTIMQAMTPAIVIDNASATHSRTTNNFAGDIKITGAGDVEVTNSSRGVILKSPNGTRYRITVSDTGVLTTTAI